ncbi:hypothetical protein ACFWIJ_40990, partial [Streptomyces sp. NPDC127079]
MTLTAVELLEVLWGRASTAPASPSQMRVLLMLEHQDGINLRTLADSLASTPPCPRPAGRPPGGAPGAAPPGRGRAPPHDVLRTAVGRGIRRHATH